MSTFLTVNLFTQIPDPELVLWSIPLIMAIWKLKTKPKKSFVRLSQPSVGEFDWLPWLGLCPNSEALNLSAFSSYPVAYLEKHHFPTVLNISFVVSKSLWLSARECEICGHLDSFTFVDDQHTKPSTYIAHNHPGRSEWACQGEEVGFFTVA